MGKTITCRIKINGMHCVQCEKRIKQALRKASGVRNVQVSCRHSSAELEYDDRISYEDIVRLIEAEGYSAAGKTKRSFPLNAALSLTAIAALYLIMQHFGLLNLLAPSQLAQSGMGYGTLFGIGLVTSVHCIAMCGGINLSQSLPDSGGSRVSYAAALLYNSGRVISYTAIGAVLGTAGYFIGGSQGISFPITLQGIIKMAAGIILFIMGLRLIGVFSFLQKFAVPLPKMLLRTAGKASARTKTPLVVGMLNSIMPCGPLQAMWMIAIASGSTLKGGISMLMFSLGTVPLMLGLGTFVAALGRKFIGGIQNSGAVVVAVMGLALLTQGGVLSGVMPVKFAAGSADNKAVSMGDVQIVESELKAGSYPEITVQNGVPVKWRIHADKSSINGCNYIIVCNKLDFDYEFHEGDNLIKFTPDVTGDIDYSCWMGMIYGKIHVIDD